VQSVAVGKHMAAPIPQETVPLNIWPCAQVPVAEQWSDGGYAPGSDHFSPLVFPELARRLVATYSSPGDVVVDAATGAGAVATAAALLRRRAVAVAPTPALGSLTSSNTRGLVPPAKRHLVSIHVGEPEAMTEIVPGTVDRASLVVLALPRRRPSDGLPWDRAAIMEASRALLAPGGCLAVVTRAEPVHGRLVDESPASIRLAEAAGLAYFQHIVVLTSSIRDGSLIADGCALAHGERCVVTHTSVLIFFKPAAVAATQRQAFRLLQAA